VTSLFRPRLVAVLVTCLALAAPAEAQFDPFHRQSAPPADVPVAAGDDTQTPPTQQVQKMDAGAFFAALIILVSKFRGAIVIQSAPMVSAHITSFFKSHSGLA